MYNIISRADVRLCCCCCCRIPAESKDCYCTYRDFQTTAVDFGRSGLPSIVPSFWFSSNPPPIHPLNTTRQQLGRYAFSFASFIICLILWRPFSYIVMTSQPYVPSFLDRLIDSFILLFCILYVLCICAQSQATIILLDNIFYNVHIHYSCNLVSLQFDFTNKFCSLQTFYSFCSYYNFYRYNFHYENNDND